MTTQCPKKGYIMGAKKKFSYEPVAPKSDADTHQVDIGALLEADTGFHDVDVRVSLQTYAAFYLTDVCI